MAYCIRGAVVCEDNSKEEILEKSRQLLAEIIQANNLSPEEIICIHFTATKDLTKAYPAVSARALGITAAALLCFQEMYVEGSMEKCIRVEVMAENGNTQKDAVAVYLGKAQALRPDLKR